MLSFLEDFKVSSSVAAAVFNIIYLFTIRRSAMLPPPLLNFKYPSTFKITIKLLLHIEILLWGGGGSMHS